MYYVNSTISLASFFSKTTEKRNVNESKFNDRYFVIPPSFKWGQTVRHSAYNFSSQWHFTPSGVQMKQHVGDLGP